MSTEQTDTHSHGDGHGHDADDGAVHSHISSIQFYVGIFLTLVVLTVLTVKVSYYDFGAANIVIALLIATMKASLVATFFMHLLHDKLFNTLAFLAAFLFLSVFIVLTYDDLGRRGQVDWGYGGTVEPHTGLAAPGGMPATSATIDDAVEEAPGGEVHKGEKAAPAGEPGPAKGEKKE